MSSASKNENLKDNSVEYLIHQVEEFQIKCQLETIDRLTRENALLYQLIIAYQKRWSRTMDLLERSQHVLSVLQRAIKSYIGDEITAERDWLTFWGIQRDSIKLPKYSPGGWI